MNKRTLLTLQLVPLALAVSQATATDYGTNGGNAVTGATWSPDASAIIAAGTITPAVGDRLIINGGNLDSGTITIAPGAELRQAATGQHSVSSHINIGGTGVDGTGAWQNTGNDWFRPSSVTITSDTTFNNVGGGWRQQGDNGTSGVGNNLFQLNGNTLTVNGSANFYFIGTTITGGGVLNVTGNSNADFNWEASGVLPADVTLNLTNSRTSSWDGAGVHMLGNINLNNGIIENRQNDGGKSFDGTITIAPASTGTFRVSRENGTTNNFMVVNGQVTGGGKFVRDGVAGESVFLTASNNNWTGGTDLNAGTTVLGADNAVSTFGPVNIAAAATLDLAGLNQTINGGTIAGNVIGGGNLNVAGATITTNLNNIASNLNVTADTTYAPTYTLTSQVGLQQWERDSGFGTANEAEFRTNDLGTSGAALTGVTDGPVGIDTVGNHETFSWIYTGEIINTTAGNVGVSFAEQYDDNVKIKLDGTVIMNDNGWNVATATAEQMLTPGAHTIEISSYEGGGGEGPNSGWTNGVAIRAGAYTITDPNGGGDAAAFLKINRANLQTLGLDFGSINAEIGANSDSKSFTVASGAKMIVDTTGVTGAPYTMNGVISGAGGLTKTGAGTLKLTGISTYSGKTTIATGTLHLTAGASIGASSEINIAAGATLQSDSSLTIGETQTVTGNGSIVANMDIEGTISPGNSIGTLTVTGNVSMFGSTVMELDNSGSPQNSDELNVSGNLTLGGALSLVNIGPGLVFGDTFDLFDGTISGSFGSIAYPSGTTAADWTNNLSTSGSITFIGVPEASTSLLSLAGGLLLMRRRRK